MPVLLLLQLRKHVTTEHRLDLSHSEQGIAWTGILFGIASIILFQAYSGFLRLNELFPSVLTGLSTPTLSLLR